MGQTYRHSLPDWTVEMRGVQVNATGAHFASTSANLLDGASRPETGCVAGCVQKSVSWRWTFRHAAGSWMTAAWQVSHDESPEVLAESAAIS